MSAGENLLNYSHTWREGSRIRRLDGTGYGDVVADEDIKDRLLAAVVNEDWCEVAFGASVLHQRQSEKGSSGGDAA